MIKNTSTYILLIGFGLILILLITSSVIGLSSISDINNSMEATVKNRIVRTDILQTMRNHARERTIALHRIILIKDPFGLDEEIQNFSEHGSKWLFIREDLKNHNLDEKTISTLEELYKSGGIIAGQQQNVIKFVRNKQYLEATELLLNTVIPGQNNVTNLYEEILKHQKQISQQEIQQAQVAYFDTTQHLISITILLLLLGTTIAFFVIRHNIRTEKKLYKDKQEIEFFAYHDTLTGLPNRRLLIDRLKIEVGHSKRQNNYAAVLFIDVDNFKTLNDSLGHKFGDSLIQQIAERISHSRRSNDTVSRLGGDEFIIILPGLANNIERVIQRAENTGNKLRNLLSESYMLDGREYHVTVSIGIAIIEKGQQSPDDLLKQSDAAMYAAKNAGRNVIRFYETSMQEKADKRLRVEQDIRSALNTGQFILHYQPQFNNDGLINGVECLVRWNHPEKGIITPNDFISIAEESALIIPMGIEILDNACAFIKSIEQNGLPDSFTSLSVNISPKQFSQSNFVNIVKEKIAEHGITPSLLMLEITEGMLLHNIDEIVVKMEALKELSIHFSIDDFGTGYSSMLYLQRLPLDELKIDQSFVKDVDTNSRNAAIVETIITMAKNLNLSVIAEGVEEDSQRAFLAEHGCNSYQGYLFERPVSGDVLLNKYFK